MSEAVFAALAMAILTILLIGFVLYETGRGRAAAIVWAVESILLAIGVIGTLMLLVLSGE